MVLPMQAAVSLIRYLHIDIEPQITLYFPVSAILLLS
jgi:hypothetical protein